MISTDRCPQCHMDIGQAYKRNEGEGLGIELIIEFTSVQNSNHKCSWQQNMCGNLSVACVGCQLWLWTGYLTICTGMWVAIKYFKLIGLPYRKLLSLWLCKVEVWKVVPTWPNMAHTGWNGTRTVHFGGNLSMLLLWLNMITVSYCIRNHIVSYSTVIKELRICGES